MRWLLASVFICSVGGQTLVRSNTNLVFGAASATVTLPSVNAADLVLLVLHEVGSASGGCLNITTSDTANGAWSLSSPGVCLTETTNTWKLQSWYLPNSAASATTVTFTANYALGSFSRCYITVLEYSGVVGVLPADGSIPTELTSGASVVGTFQAPSITTINPVDLLVSYLGTISLQASAPTIDSSFTVTSTNAPGTLRSATADDAVLGVGTYAPTWSLPTSSLAMAGQVAFKLNVPQTSQTTIFVSESQTIIFLPVYAPMMSADVALLSIRSTREYVRMAARRKKEQAQPRVIIFLEFLPREVRVSV